ncbi:hypothetical protein [Ethanoligenens harbinense]|uniref:CopG family transcriptional regulator n=1 Tax=Ethanoligenens harbinense (strain DSM 18485 / JCM 12961 / CGMCC 1.5033 / YUAN-3) TaxID=663278 RepID=E6U5J5_ETHHY|nr:hypothetical protein [Ethanoligenens harbinense]ADU25662.1 hypothetical protein Ethha_0072 [Ethanoligenens harbinense YUAN-3]ADU26103.1 hypothetical protein Ethha_0518 [Ethanoligenens harbinense YUAN-3]AVQ94838.1 hypothetical protein CXQ68_00365 [Ethanoligenens harbinense YUAN-3]AVQ95246.1 hypothetical protein CXQ68_02690 [Ethanoligenens harbinense YUAN-3]AYF37529.1 hypothetical protein CXP51_00370 [Ethanoligenens harbinense]
MQIAKTRARGTPTKPVTVRYELGVYDSIKKYADENSMSIALATESLVIKGLKRASRQAS